ncbi:MAG: CYTH domain-containing protein [Lachnospiraceae bacterium]|nr:CYTH domain-containing protein [Lachnospiraceae bacterium]
MEIERKFLVTEFPENLELYPHNELEQAYLASSGTTVRVRKIDDSYVLTVKKKPRPSEDSTVANVNEEIEEEIPGDLYERLLRYAESAVVKKTRYRIPFCGYTVELDVYHGVLEGLATAEIEYESVEAAAASPLPEWFGREVTNEREYRNSALAKLTSVESLPLS